MRVDMETLLKILERRWVITTDPSDKELCCGSPRDKDGFCSFNQYHPIYVETAEEE